MEQPKKRKSPRDDSLDLEARARVTFAATADETEESEVGSRNEEENLSASYYLHSFFRIIVIFLPRT